MQRKPLKRLARKRDEKVPRDRCVSEVRFLLKHVDAPQTLAENRLLGATPPEFARSLIEQALQRLAPRFRLIITRCDLGGELHDLVAADLGISRRHFYRERRLALFGLYDALTTGASTQRADAIPNIEADILAIERAEALSNAGFTSQAIALLDDSLNGVTEGAGRAKVLLRLTELYDSLGHYNRAGVYLEAARHLLGSESLDSATLSIVDLEMARSHASLLWHRGQVQQARRHLGAGVHRFRSAVGVQGRMGRKALTKALLVLTDILAYNGSFGCALGTALEAKQIASSLEFQPALRTQALTTLGAMRILAGVPSEAVLYDLYTAYELAKVSGFVRGIAEASNLLSKVFSSAGLNGPALRFGEAALAASLADCMNSEERLVLYCELAWVKIAAGDLDGAVSTLANAIRSQGIAPLFTFGVPKVLMAEISLARGNPDTALPLITEASADMEQIHSERGLGSALRVRAEVEAALGNRRRALRSIDEAVALLSRSAPATPLASAYNLSGRLTGNRRHKRLAREMTRILSVDDDGSSILESLRT